MLKTLLIFAHPALHKSQANKLLLNYLPKDENLIFHDLYEAYPDHIIHPQLEQKKVEQVDRIIFQFPLYWYSTPALIKEWFDIVLEYGWAYGHHADALVGKYAQIITTTGSPASSYTPEGQVQHTMEEILLPLERTFKLCGMIYQAPLVIHDALQLDKNNCKSCMEHYIKTLTATPS